MTTGRNNWVSGPYLIGLLLGIALLIRLLYLYQYAGIPDWTMLTVDNRYHHNWAKAIADGDIFGGTTYFRAPFYSFCLAALYSLFGDSLVVGRLFGLFIGLASVSMTFLLGQRIAGDRAGLIAGILHAIYPITLYFEAELLLDPLFTLLLQLTLYQWLKWLDLPQYRTILVTGLLLGLASITRPTALLLTPLLLVSIWSSGRFGAITRSDLWKNAGLLVVGTALIVTAVTTRNLIIAADPVLISSQGGINFFIGNHEGSDGRSASMPEPFGHNWQLADVQFEAERAANRELKPGEVSSYWLGKGYEWISDNP
ncbi:MAG: glycosyltransferase family 39 protein, partial [candidate division Zixibacteria bacterium]